jgi:hypothetical protein
VSWSVNFQNGKIWPKSSVADIHGFFAFGVRAKRAVETASFGGSEIATAGWAHRGARTRTRTRTGTGTHTRQHPAQPLTDSRPSSAA